METVTKQQTGHLGRADRFASAFEKGVTVTNTKKPRPHEILYKKYDFRWEILDVMIGGQSLVDAKRGLAGFPMQSAEDADRFARSYGYDLSDPIEMAEVSGKLHEAISFIRKHFLQPDNPDGLKLEVPRKFLELADPRDLLLMANMSYPGQTGDTSGLLQRNWSCAILKVMHAIAHLDRDIRIPYFAEIQKQIFDRFYKQLHRNDEGKLFLGDSIDDPLRIELSEFQTKPKKSRESMLLKILHKQEVAAAEIFDRVGIRFITRTPIDALRVVKYLKDAMIVMPPNITPARSRNTLLDMEGLKKELPVLLERLDRGELNEEAFETLIDQKTRHEAVADVSQNQNPHMSEYYRAIHFTVRQAIRIKNPAYEPIRELKNQAKKSALPEEINKLVERVDLKFLQRETKFFYPFEVQVVDRASFEENERGRSAHSEYKKAQIQTALKRVMGSLADGTRD